MNNCLFTCPLCSQPGFQNLDALRTGLVSVSTRPLECPVCSEVLLGIEKLTIHLFGHTISQNNCNNSNNSNLPVIEVTSNESQILQAVLYNSQAVAIQTWDLEKGQTGDSVEENAATYVSLQNTQAPVEDSNFFKNESQGIIECQKYFLEISSF